MGEQSKGRKCGGRGGRRKGNRARGETAVVVGGMARASREERSLSGCRAESDCEQGRWAGAAGRDSIAVAAL